MTRFWRAKMASKFTVRDYVEGAHNYTKQAHDRVKEVLDNKVLDKHTLTMLEVARDEVREANRLMTLAYSRLKKAS